MNAVDTNVLLYSIDGNEPVKQAKAQLLMQQLHNSASATMLPWQVLGELAQQLRRWRDQGKLSSPEFTQHIQAFRYVFPLLLPTPVAFDLACSLADRHSLSHWDAMLLGACQAGGVTTLYTEDMGAPRTIEGLELISPFA